MPRLNTDLPALLPLATAGSAKAGRQSTLPSGRELEPPEKR